jgi:hypothetical protein
VWLLPDDKIQRGHTVDALLPLLILSKGVIFEETLESSFCNDTDQRNKLRIRFIGAWML